MTRRERMEKLIRRFDDRAHRSSINQVVGDLGLDAFTDDAIDALAADLVDDWKRMQENNRRNRAIYAARLASN